MKRGRKLLLGIVLLPILLIGAFALWPEAPPRPTGEWMRRAGVTPRSLDVGGLRLRYARTGSGRPVLLVHGFASSIYSWSEVLPLLARDHDVIAVDLPGFGGSDIPARFDAEMSAGLLARVMEGLGIGRYSLAGNSLGGALAAVTAARHPERIERLVLLDAAAYNFAPRDRPRILRLLALLPGPLMDLGPQRPVVRRGLKQVFHDDSLVTEERVEEYLAPMARPGARRGARALLSVGASFGLPEVLRRIRAPTLVIWGAQDEWIPVRDADRFVRDIPGARKVVLQGCGHVPQEEKPREVAALIGDFLDGK